MRTLLLTALLLPAGAVAQDTQATGSPLVVTTTDAEVATGMLETFESAAEIPELAEGRAFVLTLDDGGNVVVDTGPSRGFLHVQMRPAQMVEIFAGPVQQAKMQAQGIAGMAGGQAGLDFEDAGKLVTGVFAFPSMVDRVVFSMPKSFADSGGISFDLELQPVEKTWFGDLLAAVETNAKGVNRIADRQALVTFDANIEMAKLIEPLRPIMAMVSRMGQRDKENRAAAAMYMDKTMKAIDGTMSLTFDPTGGGMKMLSGLKSPDEVKAIMHDEKYLELLKNGAESSDMAEAEVEGSAFEHRGVTVAKMTTIFDDPQMAPFSKDGTMKNFYAIAADCMLTLGFGPGEAEVKASIDALLDGKTQRAALPGGAIAYGSVRAADLMDFMSEMSGGRVEVDEDIPEQINMAINKAGTGLQITVRSK